ncbi:MAG: tetratricopeptide repeat protein [Immundisolibacteraceae bacterium]|nr:tetratricopeptide repeat protein [Immundisolibacteraceae bacterium]
MVFALNKITAPLLATLSFVAIMIAGCANDSVEDRLRSAKLQLNEQHYATAIIKLKGILSDEPNQLQALKLLGLAYHQIESYTEAEHKLKRVIGTPVSDEITRLTYADALLQLEKFPAALAAVKQAPFSETARAQATAIEAMALVGTGKFNEADQITRAARLIFPDSPDLSIALSRVYLAQGKRFASIRAARQAVNQDVTNHRVHQQLGSLLLNEKMFSSAIDSFHLALQTNPIKNLSSAALRTKLSLLRSYLATNDLESARATLAELEMAAPEHPAVTYFSALMHFSAKNYDLSYQNALATLAKIPDHQPSELLAGIVSYRLNNLEQANMYLGKVLTDAPKNTAARKLYAATQLKLNNPVGASQILHAGLRNNPDDISLQEIIDELQNVASNLDVSDPTSAIELAEDGLPNTFDSLIDALDDSQSIEIRTEIVALRQLVKAGQAAKALPRAIALIDRHPEKAGLYSFAGIIAQLAKRTEDADTFYQIAIKMAPNDIGSSLNFVNLHKLAGTLDGARASLEHLLKQRPGSFAVLTGLAEIARNNDDPELAATYFKQAISVNELLPAPRLALIRLYRQTNNTQAAAQELASAIEALPADLQFQVLHAQQLIVSGQANAAVKIVKRILTKLPDSTDALITLSIALTALDQHDQSIIPLRKAHQHLPNSYKLTARLAALETRLGNSDEAISLVENYRLITKDEAGGHVLLATIKMSLGDFEAAASEYGKAHELNPSERLILLQVASIHRGGNSQQAINLLNHWVNKHHESKKSRFELATLQLFSGQFNDAARHYQLLLDQGGEIADVFNNLAWAYQQIDDPRVLPTAEEGYNRFPEDPLLADTLGWALVTEQQDLTRAIKLLKNSFQKTGNPSIGFHLAQAQIQQGQEAAALLTLRTLLTAGKNFPERNAAKNLRIKLEKQP